MTNSRLAETYYDITNSKIDEMRKKIKNLTAKYNYYKILREERSKTKVNIFFITKFLTKDS